MGRLRWDRVQRENKQSEAARTARLDDALFPQPPTSAAAGARTRRKPNERAPRQPRTVYYTLGQYAKLAECTREVAERMIAAGELYAVKRSDARGRTRVLIPFVFE